MLTPSKRLSQIRNKYLDKNETEKIFDKNMGDGWFGELSKSQQQEYVKEHPGSKYA